MNAEFKSLAEDLKNLIEKRQWNEIKKQVETLLSGSGNDSLLVVSPVRVNASPFISWLKKSYPQLEILSCELESLNSESPHTITPDKVVIVFECGQTIDLDAVEVMNYFVFPRPISSYAIVFIHSEKILTSDELELIERGAWRLLIPEPKPAWNGQDLSNYSCYFWGENNPQDFLCTRLTKDKESLLGWLMKHGDNTLVSYQNILRLICVAEEKIRLSQKQEEKGENNARKIRRILDSLGTLRRKLMYFLDDESSSLKNHIKSSLQTFDFELSSGWIGFLRNKHSSLHLYTLTDSEWINDCLAYISEGFKQWEKKGILETRNIEMMTEFKVLMDDVDWGSVKQVVSCENVSLQYPDILFDKCHQIVELHEISSSVNQQHSLIKPEIRNSSSAVSTTFQLVTTGAISLLTANTLGLIPGILTATGGGMFVVKNHLDQNKQDIEQQGKDIIRLCTANIMDRFNDGIRDVFTSLKEDILAEIKKLEKEINTQQLSSHDTKEFKEADLQTLQEFKIKVVQMQEEYIGIFNK